MFEAAEAYEVLALHLLLIIPLDYFVHSDLTACQHSARQLCLSSFAGYNMCRVCCAELCHLEGS